MILSTILALVLAGSPASAQSPNYESVVRGFVAGLESSEMSGFNALALPGVAPSWRSVREILDQRGRMTVRSFSWSLADEEEGLVRLELEGSGDVVGLRHERLPLPPVWFLTIQQTADGPRIANAETEGHRVGKLLIAAKSDSETRALLSRHRGVSLVAVVRGINDSYSVHVLEGGDASAVHSALQIALVTAQTENDIAAEIDTLDYLSSMTMRGSGDPALSETERSSKREESLRIATMALDLALLSADCDVIAAARFSLGNLYAWQGDLNSGNRQLDLVTALGDQLRDGRVALKALVNRSIYKSRDGDLRSPLEGSELLSAKARLYGWDEGEIVASWLRADIQSAVGDYSSARDAYQFIAARFEDTGVWDRAAVARSDVAEMERKLGRATDAIATQAKAIALLKRAGATTSVAKASLALLLVESGRLERADQVLQEIADQHVASEPVPAQVSYARSVLWLAKGNYKLALREASEIISEHDDDLLWKLKTLVGRALRALGRSDEAVQELRNAIAIIEERRSRIPSNEIGRARYFESRLEPYRELVDLYFSMDRYEDALRTAEWLKARSLLDTVTIARTDLTSSLTESETLRRDGLDRILEKLNRKLALEQKSPERTSLEAERTQTRRELGQFDDEMAIRHPVGGGVRASDVSIDLQSDLPSRSVAIVEYVVLPRSTLVFAAYRVESDRIVVRGKRIAINATDLETRVQQLRDAIDARSIGSRAIARNLYDLLLSPIDRWIASPETWILVPDGPLWQVPFVALVRPSGGPLLLDKAVVYCPSLSAFAGSRTPGALRPPSILAMGDASSAAKTASVLRSAQSDVPLGRLPDAAIEVRAIASQYGPSRSVVYVGGDATETKLKSEVGRYRIVHLATHAIADSRWPMFSAILLSPTPEDDGILEAREVAEMKLDADLAVLSACDTAKGKVLSGEGVIGLAWAFLAAGCPNTVVSQWSADSKATGKQMVEFHRGLLKGDSIAQALRHAQLQLRNNPRYSDPFYWAPFVVVGHGR